MKNKTIKKFESLKIDDTKISELYGGCHNLVFSGPGEMAGINYTSDYFGDDNGDGEWSEGETIILRNDPPEGKM